MSANIFVAMPVYKTVEPGAVMTLMAAARAFAARGIGFDYYPVTGFAISFARNRLAYEFLRRPQYTHCLWWDADGFCSPAYDPGVILRMLDANEEFVACAFRKKTNDRLDYCILGEASGTLGKMYIDSVGFGAVLHQRSCLERMAALHIELAYHDWDADATVPGFFTETTTGGQRFGEDYQFCQRWRNTGGKIRLIADAVLTHADGEQLFTGSLWEDLLRPALEGGVTAIDTRRRTGT